MSTPLSTPVKQAKLRLVSGRSQPLVADFKRLLGEQHERLWTKHQQDLELIEDVRTYAKARLAIERQYTASLAKLAKQHSAHIAKRFQLLAQSAGGPSSAGAAQQALGQPDGHPKDKNKTPAQRPVASGEQLAGAHSSQLLNESSEASDSRLQKRLAREAGQEEPEEPSSLYAVWAEHSQRVAAMAKNRCEQFEQLGMVVDKLKEVRARKAAIGKKCLDTHLKRVHEDILFSMVELEKAKKLYYEDESQAKKAREHEEKIKKKRSGLMSKFTGQDLQAKKERTSARREANDIQSTQARNDYIMALAAANAHLEHYFQQDLNDFMLLIDDGLLDHCKISMATLSECDINSLKESLSNAKYWSKMINLTGSQHTSSIFLASQQSACLRDTVSLPFEPCNEDPIRCISLEYNADYALQHEIDKWLTWFKKECRNLAQLAHNLELCQRAFGEGKKSIEIGGQTVDDLEGRILELKQLIRKSEAAKQKAQARLKVIKEGGMHIEEWSVIEAEIQASAAAKAQQELEEQMRRDKEVRQVAPEESLEQSSGGYLLEAGMRHHHHHHQVKLELSQDSDGYDSVHNLASISRSPSNVTQQYQQPAQQQQASYAALADPTAAWQDDYSSAWGQQQGPNYNVVVTPDTYHNNANNNDLSAISTSTANRNQTNELLNSSTAHGNQHIGATSMTVQSSSPLSAVVDAIPPSTSPYPILGGEAYKSDFECDYNRNHHIRSTMSSAEMSADVDHYKKPVSYGRQGDQQAGAGLNRESAELQGDESMEHGVEITSGLESAYELVNRHVITLYDFDKTNEDDLSFKENELLLILEVNDENWFRARNVDTGEEGYIPAPYVRLLAENESQTVEEEQQEKEEVYQDGHQGTQPMADLTTTDQSFDRSGAWNTQDIQNEEDVYCQALYDYQPEKSFDEEDGIPYLVLRQGEAMRVIEQGVDGWWLVEREGVGERGYVPSMLVEEIGGEDNEEEEQEEGDDGDSVHSDDELEKSSKAPPPSFEPPALEPFERSEMANSIPTTSIECPDNELQKEKAQPKAVNLDSDTTTNNLTATSFIIIEPTPEVERKTMDGEEAGIAAGETCVTTDINDSGTRVESDQRVTVVAKSVPPASTSYSIVNEDFVLERPTRRPSHHHSEQIPHHETPTILEENEMEIATREELRPEMGEIKFPSSSLEEDNETRKEAPPCVVIETCEDKARLDDEDDTFSLDEDSQPSGFSSQGDFSGSSQNQYAVRANVDVSPILRYRAEQFSKQIIEEALELVQEASFERQTIQPTSNLTNPPTTTTNQNYYL